LNNEETGDFEQHVWKGSAFSYEFSRSYF